MWELLDLRVDKVNEQILVVHFIINLESMGDGLWIVKKLTCS